MANIISFKIKNFKSYKDEVEFSFRALNSDFRSENYHEVELSNGEVIRLLNSAVIYGANASGKSNIIWALFALTSYVKTSREHDPEQKLRYEPYLLSSETEKAPISLGIEFIAEGLVYLYQITYNAECFIFEKLTCTTNNTVLFERNKDVVSFYAALAEFSGREFLKNHLVLSKLALDANTVIQNVYKELSTIQSFPVGNDIYLSKVNEKNAEQILVNNQSILSQRLKKIVHKADLGIEDVNILKHDFSNVQFPAGVKEEAKRRFIEENTWEIKMKHLKEDGSAREFGIEDESAGTRVLFGVASRILDVLERGCFLAYDEMNIAMHPRLFHLLVKLFHDPKSNPHGAQLLITTHDTGLLQDQLMRADQVWFAEKNSGVSELFSVQDFYDETDGVTICPPYEAWYRSGRFGALPHPKDIESIFS